MAKRCWSDTSTPGSDAIASPSSSAALPAMGTEGEEGGGVDMGPAAVCLSRDRRKMLSVLMLRFFYSLLHDDGLFEVEMCPTLFSESYALTINIKRKWAWHANDLLNDPRLKG